MTKEIKIYSMPTCPACKSLKDYLAKKDVEFENIDLSQDREKVKELVEVSGQMGVPVAVIVDEVVIGFDKAKIDSLIT